MANVIRSKRTIETDVLTIGTGRYPTLISCVLSIRAAEKIIGK
jgi:hypothetical protein